MCFVKSPADVRVCLSKEVVKISLPSLFDILYVQLRQYLLACLPANRLGER